MGDSQEHRPLPAIIAWMVERRRATGKTPSIDEIIASGHTGKVVPRVLTIDESRDRIWRYLDKRVREFIEAEDRSK